METSHRRPAVPKLRTEDFPPDALQKLQTAYIPSCQLDVHTHAHELQQGILSCGRKARHWAPTPRKQTISAETWTLIQQKKKWRSQLHEQQALRHQTLLLTVFASWRFFRVGQMPIAQLRAFDAMICELDFAVAKAFHYFRNLGRQNTSGLRQDDNAFFAGLASSVSEVLAPHQTKDFWKTLRRSLPKFRQRRIGFDPHKLEILQDQWGPYFTQLESGVETSADGLVEICHQRQMNLPTLRSDFCCSELPSLIELEDVFRDTAAEKATGLDPLPSGLFCQQVDDLARIHYHLILKIFMWQHEPVAAKGGVMAVIHKRGSEYLASNYRGIMLLPSLAKKVHALLRKRLMFLLGKHRPQGQIGGFSSMPVTFGSQMLQVFGRLMDAMHVSSAIIFVDLSNAFHRLVRELVSGVHVSHGVEDVLERLMQEGIPVDDLLDLLQLPTLLAKINAPPFLQQLVQDLHSQTWMILPGMSRPIITKKGTRPGSPLADCIFHILMMDTAGEINSITQQNTVFQRILTRADLHIESVIWADDVAIPVATEQAADLPAVIDSTLSQVHRVFHKRRFTFNTQRGKTSVVASFKGVGAPLMRAQFQLGPRPGMNVVLGNETAFIHFMDSYKHLGTMFNSSHTLDREIDMRIGLAKGAFARVSKDILRNRRIPECTRVQLFRSLILSRLLFGLGAWSSPSGRQMQRLQNAVLSLLRKLFRLTPQEIQTTTASQLLVRAQIGSLRARLALDRLLYAQRLWQFGPDMLQHALHREEALLPDSWMLGLKHDIFWLCKLDCQGVPPLQALAGAESLNAYDLTDLFDFWQSGDRAWARCVNRAWRCFLQQERMMVEILSMHKTFFRVLKEGGASFRPDPLGTPQAAECLYSCHCGRSFTTPQGLSCHKRLAHGEYAPEHGLIDGVTCPECLQYFWTKQRLYQHLAYVSRTSHINPCFQALKKRGFIVEHDGRGFSTKPAEVRGLARVEALQTFGPQNFSQTFYEQRNE
eukprot:s2367_g5.t1